MARVPFIKMHGLGNDFVIIDQRQHNYNLSIGNIKKICDRHFGIGCDQLVVIENCSEQTSNNGGVDAKVIFYNADGSVSASCGNATRCVAYLLGKEKEHDFVKLETTAGNILECEIIEGMNVKVNMGHPSFDYRDIELARAVDTLHLEIGEGDLKDPVAVSMGNPHAVFFVTDVESVPLAVCGPILECHPIFLKKANIGIAQIIEPRQLKLRVWERGVGETLACGSGACAAVVAATKRGLLPDKTTIEVNLPGGELAILWDDDVFMTGKVAISFSGEVNL